MIAPSDALMYYRSSSVRADKQPTVQSVAFMITYREKKQQIVTF